jgi:hypothetical protein
MIESVLIYALLQNSRNENDVQTPITGRNLPYLTEFATRRFQEEGLATKNPISFQKWGL